MCGRSNEQYVHHGQRCRTTMSSMFTMINVADIPRCEPRDGTILTVVHRRNTHGGGTGGIPTGVEQGD